MILEGYNELESRYNRLAEYKVEGDAEWLHGRVENAEMQKSFLLKKAI